MTTSSEPDSDRVNGKAFLHSILAWPRFLRARLKLGDEDGNAASKTRMPKREGRVRCVGYPAARAVRNRASGLSLIGKCTKAANRPKPTPAHHMAS